MKELNINTGINTDTEVALFEEQTLDTFRSLSNLTKEKKRLEAEEKEIKKYLEEKMDEFNIKSFDNEFIKITRVEGSESVSIDLKVLADKEPSLYLDLIEDYPKISKRNPYVRFTVR